MLNVTHAAPGCIDHHQSFTRNFLYPSGVLLLPVTAQANACMICANAKLQKKSAERNGLRTGYATRRGAHTTTLDQDHGPGTARACEVTEPEGPVLLARSIAEVTHIPAGSHAPGAEAEFGAAF